MLNLSRNEEEILQYWKSKGILDKVREKNKGGKLYFFLEGPPYANGELHMGHIRGYTRKDAILRYMRMRGRAVFDRAGFDVHGLPIENRVEKNLNIKSKREIETIGVKSFIKACIDAYKTYSTMQISMARRYGVWFDFDHAYIPATPEYMDKAITVFKRIYDKGLVYRDVQVMPYCMHCGTVLAKGPEVEEEFDTDPSVYVMFKINRELSKPRIKLGENTHFLIWTTTPWTLPGNVLVCVNPKAMYLRVKMKGNEIIVAKERLDVVAGEIGESPIVIEEFAGSQLDGIRYMNPLEEFVPAQKDARKHHRIVFSEELVSMTDGTGLVHIAPAFGPEDFLLGKKEKAPLLSIVGIDGAYNGSGGKYEGIRLIHDANREVEKDLKALGVMPFKSEVRHSYPHCWRCHEKLVYLPTEQWFIDIGRLKKKIIRACEKIRWYPEDLKKWFVESVETAPDWVISRQRYWDIPIPIWICDACKSERILGSYEEIKTASNGKIRFTSEDLHRPVIDELVLKCEKCNGEMHRIKDVFDVWYDSGVAHTASLGQEEFNRMYGKAFVTEGPDQIRGWFATLMKTGIAAYGRSPFDKIVMQGWVVDSKGKAMHKSKGNYVSAEDLVGKYPLDAVRAFTLSHITHENLKFSEVEIEEMQGMILLLYNIGNLLREYSDVISHKLVKVKRPARLDKLDYEDAWIVSRLNETVKTATEGFDNYDVSRAVNSVKKFVVEDLSRFYLKGAKKSVMELGRKKAKQKLEIINYVLFNILLTIAPVIPFATEKIYLENYGKESVFLEDWPRYNEKLISRELEGSFDYAIESITAMLNARESANIKLRQPLASAVIEVKDDAAFNSLQRLVYLIEDYTNVRKVEIRIGVVRSKEVRPMFGNIGPDFKENAGAIGEALKSSNADELLKEIAAKGHYSLHTEKGTFNITEKHFTIVERAFDKNALAFRYGVVHLNTEISEELREDALVREFERSIQLLRKGLQLKKMDVVKLYCTLPPTLLSVVNKNKKSILKNINARGIYNLGQGMEFKEVDVEGERIKVNIERFEKEKA